MLRIAYLNYWTDPFNGNDDYFTRFITYHMGPVELVHYSSSPDLLIASCFGNIEHVANTVARRKLFYYGENLERYPPYNNDELLNSVFDMVIGFRSTNGHLRFPLWLMYYPFYKYEETNNILTFLQARYDDNKQKSKTIFATCVARHDRNGIRTAICNEFEKHGQVTYPGMFRNNVDAIGPSATDKIAYISHSIFSICPENSEYEGYCTEKIFQAFEGGTIPVYWGIGPPEPDIICANKYCTPDSIAHAIEHNSEYLDGPIFKPGAGNAMARFYHGLADRIRSSLFDANDIITGDRLLALDTGNKRIAYIKTDVLYNERAMTWRNKPHSHRPADVWITGHSDYEISSHIFETYQHSCDRWFCVNKNTDDPKLHALPLGITNDCNDSPIHGILGNIQQMIGVMNMPKENKYLMYMNFNISNYPMERGYVHNLFRNTSWTKTDVCIYNAQSRLKFLREIRNSKFVICPRGNGIDTHRLWETLYMGSIPIVLRHIALDDFDDLPILFIDHWDQITEEFLECEYNRIIQRTDWNYDKLRLGYWIRQITT